MSPLPRNTRRRSARRIAVALTCGLGAVLAHADAQVPSPGSGSIKFMLRQFDATKVFLPNEYSTATAPGSELRYTMLRMTGTQGLIGPLALQYDLRAARIQKIRTHHGERTVTSSTGLQDQEIGLAYGLTRRPGIPNAVTLSVITATGSVNTAPNLGVGHTAIEPDYQIGLADPRWRTTLTVGTRIFLDGATAQMRAELDASARLSRRLELGFVLFYVRTLVFSSTLSPTDRSERYNLLRPGVRLKYRISARLKPFIEFEQDVAGQAIHAGRRITVGVSYAY